MEHSPSHITWLLLIMEHFSVSVGICAVLSSFAFLTCILLFLPLSAKRMDESLQPESVLNLLFALCLSVSLSVCVPAFLSACSHHDYLLFLIACLSAGSYLCLCQLLPCSNNSLSPCCWPVCLPACERSHVFLLVLSQLAASVPPYQAPPSSDCNSLMSFSAWACSYMQTTWEDKHQHIFWNLSVVVT